MERHRTDIESMRMVSGFRNKEEHKTEPTGSQKGRGGSVFCSSATAKGPAAQLADGGDVIIV